MRNDAASRSRLQVLPAVEIACGAGAPDDGCKDGPAAFRRTSDEQLRRDGLSLLWHDMPRGLCDADMAPLEAVSQTARWTASVTRRLANARHPFVAIGGDHSCAVGTWSGVADAWRPRGPIGLIWIDAHMDMHVPETTPSGAIHGMPVAALLGHGAPQLTSIAKTGPALAARHVCLVGARSFEPEEIVFAERFGVRVIAMEEVRRIGIDAALAEARTIAASGTVGFGVSLDLDAFDPADAPGVGSPAPDGIAAADFMTPWRKLYSDAKCLGLELVEYNPAHDKSARTARLMERLILAREQAR
jgi:arginase